MTNSYLELQQFLASYFNQDWPDEYASADDVISSFISESSADTLIQVNIGLRELLLTDRTEQELQDYLFFEIGCNYYYPYEWKSGKTWLKHVSSLLTQKINDKR
ncbi:hypothetical protein GIR22_17855 [Pseudomonas sp. CCM 7891]|uniref:CdiI immunity protein domain-containing protein n=1 Tax=Pseudomonas karstica TaxID=1055468 RepID=A0A7X2RUW7_9PSED|nr:contact-dependent growth inhibition system immunity protein [Pseudomonas karstica]MTD20991.1 hypothetical protein [Pseudomonas karstica]